MNHSASRAGRLVRWASRIGDALRDYFGSGSRQRTEPVRDREALRQFLETRASFVAQTSLYGYLRTRAGMLYPQLFDDDEFVRSVNIAKWHVWLACLADLAVFAGGRLFEQGRGSPAVIRDLISSLVGSILDDTGIPAEADDEFAAHADRVRARVAGCDWERITDDEQPFSDSPTALVRWAPIVQHLKELDEEIVRNSVRFRWQEVRRDLRRHLDAAAVLHSAGTTTSAS